MLLDMLLLRTRQNADLCGVLRWCSVVLAFALPASPAISDCWVDIACEGWRWNELNTAKECKDRYDYCMEINTCWSKTGHTSWILADNYRFRVIEPSYKACRERMAG